jgi:hypothetical protein
MDDNDLLKQTGKLYHRYRGTWVIKGYSCNKCGKYYHSPRRELFDHLSTCIGITKKKKILED